MWVSWSRPTTLRDPSELPRPKGARLDPLYGNVFIIKFEA